MKPILFKQPLYTFTLFTVSIKSAPSTFEQKRMSFRVYQFDQGGDFGGSENFTTCPKVVVGGWLVGGGGETKNS